MKDGWTEPNSSARAFRDAALISSANATGAFAVQFDTDVSI